MGKRSPTGREVDLFKQDLLVNGEFTMAMN